MVFAHRHSKFQREFHVGFHPQGVDSSSAELRGCSSKSAFEPVVIHTSNTQASDQFPQVFHRVIHRHVCRTDVQVGTSNVKGEAMTLTSIAEMYLTMLSRSENNVQERVYVRLAYKYGVPFGRIVALSGVPADRVVAHIEGGD